MSDRSPEKLLAVIKSLDPEHNPKYQRRDVTGDGIPEDFCNVLAQDFCAAMGCPIPKLLANDLFDWLNKSNDDGVEWSEETPEEAVQASNLGLPVLAIAKVHGGHGHVAIVVPSNQFASDSPSQVRVAQAGETNFSDKPVVWGFGYLRPSYFVHS